MLCHILFLFCAIYEKKRHSVCTECNLIGKVHCNGKGPRIWPTIRFIHVHSIKKNRGENCCCDQAVVVGDDWSYYLCQLSIPKNDPICSQAVVTEYNPSQRAGADHRIQSKSKSRSRLPSQQSVKDGSCGFTMTTKQASI